ncbi:tandem-95 repeat protein [Spongiibacter nanhainus]|uniref:Tandem-95 repeat protein n=1 Tax=Spongiibacter nanhainus TaxID=2794344 RepID=A0A7T4QYK8_9GAMM|nr:tandem-95 repeat protein [Spongiibacter nanhainus]QQD17082.1 tandem-95 repeat protein [Spongiibacter nanhainus]
MTKPAIVAGPTTDSLLADYAENLPFPNLDKVELSTMLVADLGNGEAAYLELREEEKERIIQEPYQGGGVSLGASNFTDSVVSLLTYGIVGGAIYYATDDDDDESDSGFRAVNDSVDLLEGGDPVVVNVLENDRAGPNGGELQIIAADTSTGNGIAITDLGNGEFSLDIGDDYQQLLPGDKIKDAFTYTIENEAGEQSTGTVNVTINGDIDSAPEVTAPSSASTEESTSVTLAGIQVSDIDIGNRNLEVVLSAGNGTLEASDQGVNIRGNGSDELTLRGEIDDINSVLQSIAYTPDESFSGEDTIAIKVSDDTSTVPASIAITVTPSSNPSINAEDDTATVEEGGDPLTVNVLDNDSFEGDVTVTVAATTANGIAVTNNNDGTLTLDIGDGFAQLLPSDTATDTLTYTIEDELGQQSSATIDITVEGTTNDEPINTTPSSLTTSTNTSLAITGLSVSDVDTDILDLELDVDDGSLSVVEGDAEVSGNNSDSLTLSGSQSAIHAALQTLSYTPDDDFEGDDVLAVQTSDGESTIDSSIDIDVQANAATLTAEDDSVDLEEAGDPITVDLLANDTFGGERSNISLTISDTTPNGVTLINNGDGTVSFDPGANFATLLPGESVQETLSYQLTDQNNATSSASVSITVTGAVNDAPEHVLPNTPTGDTNSDVDLSALQVTDIDAGDEILTTTVAVDQGTLSVNDSGTGVSGNMTATLTLSGELQQINALLQSLAFTPEADFSGDAQLSVSTDDGDNTTSDQLTITVNSINAVPQAENDTVSNAQDSVTTSYSAADLLANDSDDDEQDTLQVVDVSGVSTLGAAVVLDPVSGDILYDPTTSDTLASADDDLVDLFEYIISDGNGGFASASVQLTATDSDTPNQKVNEYFVAAPVSNSADTETNGLYSFLEFDGNSDNGSGQSWINLDALFDSLGFSNADRAGGEGFQVIGSSLFVDLDNDNSTGDNGGFEYEIATIADAATVSGTFDNADVIAGTDFVV